MITFVLIAGFAVLVLGLLALLYFGTKHSKSDETGRAQATPQTPPQTRASGREA